MRMVKIKSSVLVIVLIVVAIASAVLLFLSYRIVNETEQQGLEKTSSQAEQIAKIGVERIVQNITNISDSTPNVVMSSLKGKKYASLSLAELGICSNDLHDAQAQNLPYCSSESKIIAFPLFVIIDYNLKNDETIQVNMVDLPQSPDPNAPDISLIFKKGPNIVLVVTAFNSNYEVVGKCVIKTKPTLNIYSFYLGCVSVSSSSVTKSASVGEVLTVHSSDNIIKIDSTGVAFFRIKALTPGNANGNVNLSVTGVNSDRLLVNLPTAQQYYLRSAVYTGTGDKTTFYQYNIVIMAHPMVPEVFDWVLFNGGNGPIDK